MSLWSRLFGRAPAERREPLFQPGPQIVGGYRRLLPRRGTRALLEAYDRSPVLQAVASKIAFGVASCDWFVTVDGNEAPGHVLESLLSDGCEGLSGLQATMTEELHLLLAGEAFSILDRNMTGAPFRRWPIPPQWVQSVPRPGDEWFNVSPSDGGQAMTLHRHDVLWLKEVSPLNPYDRGAGIGRALGDELETDERAAQHMAATLANRALPETIISAQDPSGPLDPAVVERLEATMNERFGGPRNAGRTLVASGKLSVDKLTPSFSELKLVELREYERDAIIHGFGVSPFMLGIVTDVNRANAEAAESVFAKHVIEPRLRLRRSVINTQLATQYGRGVRAEYISPVREDRAFKLEVAKAQPAALSVDEWREMMDLPPLDDGAGKRYPMPFAVTFGEHLAEGAEPAIPAPAVERSKAMTKAPDDAANIIPHGAFVDLLGEAIRAAVAEFGQIALDELSAGISFDLVDPLVREAIEARAAEASRLIVGTTRDQLRATLGEGVEAGESTDKLVARIRDTLGAETTTARAKMISRTEIVRASNFGTTEAHRAAGIETREWLATQDGNVRDAHAELDGKRAGIDEPFNVNGAAGMYPGGFGVAALDINCRCGVLPVFDGLDERSAKTRRVAMWKSIEARRAAHEQMLERRLRVRFSELARDAVRALEG